MDWITDEVAIGNHLEAKDVAFLKRHGFRSVLSLDGTLAAEHAVEIGLMEVVSYRLIDGAGNDLRVFRFAVDDLRRLVETLPPVLVQCHAGRSRSVAVVAGYLMAVRGDEPEEAFELSAERREIHVAPELIELLYGLVE